MRRLDTSSTASESEGHESEALGSSDFGLARFDDVTDLVTRISLEERRRLLSLDASQVADLCAVSEAEEPEESPPSRDKDPETSGHSPIERPLTTSTEKDSEEPQPSDESDEFVESDEDEEESATALDFVAEPEVTLAEVVVVANELRPIDPAVDDIEEAFPIAMSYEIECRPQLIDMINHSIAFYIDIDEKRIEEMITARDLHPWVSYKISQSNQRIFTFDIRGGEFIWLQNTKTAKLVSAVGGLSTNFPASQNVFMPLIIFVGMVLVVIGFLLINQGFLLNTGLAFCLAAAFAWLYYNMKTRLTLDVTTVDFIVNERYQGPLSCLREVREDRHGRIVAVIDFRQKQVEEIIAPIIPREQREYLVATLNREIDMLRQFERNV